MVFLMFFVSMLFQFKAMAVVTVEVDNFELYVPESLSKQFSEEEEVFLRNRYTDFLNELKTKTNQIIPQDIKGNLSNKKFVFTMVKDLAPYGMFLHHLTKEWDEKNMNLFNGEEKYFDENTYHVFFNPFEEMSEQFRILAHEYFHAIHFILNPFEEDWVKEGMAQVFEMKVTGKPFREHLEGGLNDLTSELITEYDHSHYSPQLYGHHFLYFYYLEKNCGSMDLFWKIAKSNYPPPMDFNLGPIPVPSASLQKLSGKENIDLQLRSLPQLRPHCRNFENATKSFEIGRVLNRDVWDINDEKQYFIYSYHPSPQINIFTHGIEAITPLYVPFLVTDADTIKHMSQQHVKNFSFFIVRLMVPRLVKEYDNPSELLENFKPGLGDTIIILKTKE